MSLHGHARAARILGEEALRVAEAHGDPFLTGYGTALLAAAARMEAEARADIAAIGGGCTLDHTKLRKGQRCLACQ